MIERYDMVVRRIARRHRVTRGTARAWFEEMVRYLDLCAESPVVLAPSKKVDKAWHEFLLFTRAYAEFCDERYGRFVHHDPHERPDPDAYRRTYEAYAARHGRPSRRVWRNPYTASGTAACGTFGGGGDGGGGSCGGGGGGGCGGGGGG